MDLDDLPPDQAIHMEGAPVHVAGEWLREVFDESNLAGAWPLTDGPFRLALAQSWILLNEDLPEVACETAMNWRRHFQSPISLDIHFGPPLLAGGLSDGEKFFLNGSQTQRSADSFQYPV